MQAPVFIGDSLSAAGFRLGGAVVKTPKAGSEEAVFRTALAEGELVLITAEIASRLPNALLEEAMIENNPLVVVIPDVRGRQQPVDIANSLRRQLGMTE
jgi:vacuolar-type H+-ATPase subunit F/Vma7